MTLILGNFVESLPCEKNSATINLTFNYQLAGQQYLHSHLCFGFTAIQMLKAIYLQTGYKPIKFDEIKNSVDYITSELLENSIKYGDFPSLSIGIKIHVTRHIIIIVSTNFITKIKEESFQKYIQKVITSDTSELYLKQLEENIDNDLKSGLGLLSIINDYKAKIGWKFEPLDRESKVLSSVMVQLPIV